MQAESALSIPMVDTVVREIIIPEPSPWDSFSICLPHPYLTRYFAKAIPRDAIATAPERQPGGQPDISYRIFLAPTSSQKQDAVNPRTTLHNPALSFDALELGHEIPDSNNTQWARARRSPSTIFTWTSAEPPSVAQLWLLIYSFFTVYYTEEVIRVNFIGSQTDLVREELIAVGLAIRHPLPVPASETWSRLPDQELLIVRSAFWQGAGSPFGVRSAWTPSPVTARQPIQTFPLYPTTQTLTTRFPSEDIHTLHPIRPAKPQPGSIIYSRYIPHLNEHYSMVALDYHLPEHLNLFHTWQNDPRVAAGWNETGTLDEHRTYLKNLHDDPHVLTMLACFDDVPFAYFEVYWAKEDRLGAYYAAGDWDRGRHSLVGNTTYRGPHRAHAWWSSLMHYMFLDDPRTEFAVGEPKYTNTRVLELDGLHGFHVEKFVDLPHKRSAFVRCSRERYFGLCTVGAPWLGTAKDRLEKL